MKIINAMFAKGLGGIEQAFIDYTNALILAGHEVICITQPDAKINEKLKDINGIKHIKVPNAGQWDIFAKLILFGISKHQKADAIIAHGNRAISLFKLSKSNDCPLIGVAHNYSTKKFRKLSAAFTVTKDLKQHLENTSKIKSQLIFAVPNMVNLPENEPEYLGFHQNIVFGTIARHVKKKALDVLIKAAARAKENGLKFKLLIGGLGDETRKLQELRDKMHLHEEISFIGWVTDKEAFYNNIDIFMLPSAHEPFGIVVLEAFKHKKPLITTESEGPREIVKNEYDALTCPIGEPEEMASRMLALANDPEKAKVLAQNGYKTVSDNYNIIVVSNIIKNALETIKSEIR